MARIRITKPYTMSAEEVRAAARELAGKLEMKHGVRSRWHDDAVSIRGAGVDGKMSFADGLIEVSVKLGLLASAFEPALRKEIQKYLDKHVS